MFPLVCEGRHACQSHISKRETAALQLAASGRRPILPRFQVAEKRRLVRQCSLEVGGTYPTCCARRASASISPGVRRLFPVEIDVVLRISVVDARASHVHVAVVAQELAEGSSTKEDRQGRHAETEKERNE